MVFKFHDAAITDGDSMSITSEILNYHADDDLASQLVGLAGSTMIGKGLY